MTKEEALKAMDDKITASENSVANIPKGSIMHMAAVADAILFAQRDARKLIEQIDHKPNEKDDGSDE